MTDPNALDARGGATAAGADLLGRVWRALEAAGIRYVVLRDAERLEALAAAGGELDLLVDAAQAAALGPLLAGLGFVDLDRWGHAPHRFFLAYDPAGDRHFKLDVVTAIAFGRPSHALRTDLAGPTLARRRRFGGAWAPAPEEGLVCLLLHAWLDTGRIAEKHRLALAAAGAGPLDEARLAEHLAAYGPPGPEAARIPALIRAGDWAALEAMAPAVARRLAARDPWGTRYRRLRDPALRRLDRIRGLVAPRLPRVALLAPDGAGKSTLAAGIAASSGFPTRLVYMGLYQQGARRGRLARVKGLGLAANLATLWRRWLLGRWHQGRGRLVVFDRYSYDARLPGAGPSRPGGGLRRRLLARACPAPELVLVLDAPGELLYARKGEHSPERLEAQRQGYLAIAAGLPGALRLDATRDADSVRRAALTAIWACFGERSRGRAAGEPEPARLMRREGAA